MIPGGGVVQMLLLTILFCSITIDSSYTAPNILDESALCSYVIYLKSPLLSGWRSVVNFAFSACAIYVCQISPAIEPFIYVFSLLHLVD